MSRLAYTKTADLADLQRLYEACLWVRAANALEGQHPIREWEYAMALYTIGAWQLAEKKALADAVVREVERAGYPGALVETIERTTPLSICDVGGAGSKFTDVLSNIAAAPVTLIDPRLEQDPRGVEEVAAAGTHVERFDILTCISVIEHVPQVVPFLRAAHALLKPGGLLFLTTDYWDVEGPDTAHFHWMRQRIYNAHRMKKLCLELREMGFKSFGDADWKYHGPQAYDYSVCSLAMVKK